MKTKRFQFRFRFRNKVIRIRSLGSVGRYRQRNLPKKGLPVPWFYPGPWPQSDNSYPPDSNNFSSRVRFLDSCDLRGGAGGSTATKRKRLETQGSLANALDTFLQNWIAEQPQTKTPKSSGKGQSFSKGKGKGKIVSENPQRQVQFQSEDSFLEPESNNPRGGDVPLARTLLNILKQCLNKGSTDSEVVAILRQQLKDPFGGNSEGVLDPGNRAQAPSKPRPPNRGKGVGNTQTQQSTQVPNVTALRPAEWTIPPDVCSFQKLQTVLRDGTLTTHNMVEIRTKADFYQFETLWQAFDAPGGITVLCTGPATEVLEVMGTRKTLFRGKMGPKVENVAIKRYGNQAKCPWSAPTTKVQKDALPIVSKVTVRIVAPQAYRQIFLPEGEEDSPASIIGLAAQNAKIPVAVLTGGRWSKQYFGNKPQTTGFVRVSTAAAEKLLKISGDHGIFFTKVQEEANNPKPSFFWFGKKPSESPESYFRRCKVLASEREQPLVLRTGGGSDLGCLRKNTDSTECRPRVVDLWGIPRNWDAEEVCSLLSTLKWENGQVLSRKRFGKHWSWRVKATPPKDSIEKGSWVYEIADSPAWTLEILLAPPKNPSITSERVPGPKRLFGDVTLEDFLEHSKTDKRGRGTQRRDNRPTHRDRSRTPPRSKDDEKPETDEQTTEDSNMIPSTELDPASQECLVKPLNSFPIDPTEAVKHFNWQYIDWQGSGDCGFRAVADGWVKKQHRETWTQDDAKRGAAWLRAEAISHIRKHHAKFKDFVPTNCSSFEDWLQKASQSSYWISGVLLQALAERLGTPIIIFKWDEISKSWRRFCIAARFSGGWACKAKNASPIAVVLEKKHYVALRPKDENDFPKSWLKETASPSDSEFVIDLTGAGRQASSSSSKVSTKRDTQKNHPDFWEK